MPRQLLLPLPECEEENHRRCTLLCNRCNAAKESNGPCTQCGSPEFRIVKERNKCLLILDKKESEES